MSKHKSPTDSELAQWEKYGSYAGHDAVQRMVVEIHNLRADTAQLKEAVGYDEDSIAESLRAVGRWLEDGADVRVWAAWLISKADSIDDILAGINRECDDRDVLVPNLRDEIRDLRNVNIGLVETVVDLRADNTTLKTVLTNISEAPDSYHINYAIRLADVVLEGLKT